MQKTIFLVSFLTLLATGAYAGNDSSGQGSCGQELTHAGDLHLYPQMSSRNSSRGNFRSVIAPDANGKLSLFLPADVYRIAQGMNLVTLLDFISIVYSFPEAVTGPLGWSAGDLAQAIQGLEQGLAAVGMVLPADERSPPVSFGANRPKRRK